MEHTRRLRSIGSGRTWGSFDIYPSRYGITRYRLVMFPPGISSDERRLLRAWRTWPVWGSLLFLASQLWLTHAMAARWALAISATIWLLSGAVAFAFSAQTRSRVRCLNGIAVTGPYDDDTVNQLAAVRALATTLLAADARRDEGVLSELDHEAICWQSYQQIGQLTAGPTARL